MPLAPPAKRPRGRPRGSGTGPRGPRGPRGTRGRPPLHNVGHVGGSYNGNTNMPVGDANSLYEIVKLGKTSLQVSSYFVFLWIICILQMLILFHFIDGC